MIKSFPNSKMGVCEMMLLDWLMIWTYWQFVPCTRCQSLFYFHSDSFDPLQRCPALTLLTAVWVSPEEDKSRANCSVALLKKKQLRMDRSFKIRNLKKDVKINITLKSMYGLWLFNTQWYCVYCVNQVTNSSVNLNVSGLQTARFFCFYRGLNIC